MLTTQMDKEQKLTQIFTIAFQYFDMDVHDCNLLNFQGCCCLCIILIIYNLKLPNKSLHDSLVCLSYWYLLAFILTYVYAFNQITFVQKSTFRLFLFNYTWRGTNCSVFGLNSLSPVHECCVCCCLRSIRELLADNFICWIIYADFLFSLALLFCPKYSMVL